MLIIDFLELLTSQNFLYFVETDQGLVRNYAFWTHIDKIKLNCRSCSRGFFDLLNDPMRIIKAEGMEINRYNTPFFLGLAKNQQDLNLKFRVSGLDVELWAVCWPRLPISKELVLAVNQMLMVFSDKNMHLHCLLYL